MPIRACPNPRCFNSHPAFASVGSQSGMVGGGGGGGGCQLELLPMEFGDLDEARRVADLAAKASWRAKEKSRSRKKAKLENNNGSAGGGSSASGGGSSASAGVGVSGSSNASTTNSTEDGQEEMNSSENVSVRVLFRFDLLITCSQEMGKLLFDLHDMGIDSPGLSFSQPIIIAPAMHTPGNFGSTHNTRYLF